MYSSDEGIFTSAGD